MNAKTYYQDIKMSHVCNFPSGTGYCFVFIDDNACCFREACIDDFLESNRMSVPSPNIITTEQI